MFSHCATFLATKAITNKFISIYIDTAQYAVAFKLLEMVKEVPPVNCNNCMKVVCEDRLPMSLENIRAGCRVFVRLGSCRMEVVGSVGSIVDTCGGSGRRR